MELKLTKTSPPVKTNCFVVEVEYQHGDADTTDTEKYTLNTISHSDLEKYLLKFKEVKTAIDDMRGYGAELPEWIKCVDVVDVAGTNFHIELVSDAFSQRSNYFASMYIKKIIFYDENGSTFKVEYKL